MTSTKYHANVAAPRAVRILGLFFLLLVVSEAYSSASTLEFQRIAAPAGQFQGGFGSGLAISGNTAAIGNPGGSSGGGSDLGSVFVYIKSPDGWVLQDRVFASDGIVGANFGSSIALEGDTLVVGAVGMPGPFHPRQGAAYVFTRTNGVWTQQAKLSADSCAGSFLGCNYGVAVTLRDGVIAVGAPNQSEGSMWNRGAVFLYTLNDGQWSFEQRLGAFDSASNKNFGFSVAINRSDDTLVVGATGDAVNGNHQQGSAYVYVRENATWSFSSKLVAPDGSASDQLGNSVAIYGNTVAIGARYDDVGNILNQGSVHIFEREINKWVHQTMLTDPDKTIGGQFGLSLALDEDKLVISQVGFSVDKGRAFLFKRADSTWTILTQLGASDGASNDQFGRSVAIEDRVVLVSAPEKFVGNNEAQGVAYIFHTQMTPVDLWSEDDTGLSDSDDITNKRTLRFTIRDILPGAQVEVRRNGIQLLSVVADDSVLNFTDPSVPANKTTTYSASHTYQGQASSPTETLVTVDTIAPASWVFQAPGQPDPTRHQPIAFSCSFNEPVYGELAPIDISLAGSSANVSAANIKIETTNGISIATVDNILSDGLVRLSVKPNVVQDIAGNFNLTSIPTDNSVTLDTIGPNVTIDRAASQSSPTGTFPVQFTAVFSEPVSQFNSVSFVGSTANVSSASVTITGNSPTATVFTVNVRNVASDGGQLVVSIPPGSALDLAGNPSFASTSTDNSVTIDTVRPTVVINQAAGQPDPATSLPINFTVQFSEFVTNFDMSAIRYGGSSVDTSNATAVITGSGSTYNLAIGNIVPNGGILRVSLGEGAARDVSGNLSSNSTSTDNTVTVSNRILDGGFEATDSTGQNVHWTSTSTRFGTSLCRSTLCGTGGGTAGPRNGNGWVWFDGSDNTNAELATVSQQVQFPPSGSAILSYHLRIGSVRAPVSSVFRVKINGSTVQTINEPSESEPAYTERLVDLTAYANGQLHTLTFEYFRPASAPSDNFTIDDVSLIVEKVVVPKTDAAFDFDGDGKTDVSVYRANGGSGGAEWWYLRSSDGSNGAFAFGANTDTPVPADFTGDGKTDVAFWRPSTGEWYVIRSEDSTFFAFPFGSAGDVPMPGDFDGDGEADATVFRPSANIWFTRRSSDGQVTTTPFGAAGDKPVAADFDGDGKADIAIYRPNGSSGSGEWWYQRSSDGGNRAFAFGSATDKAVPADFTGDGKADLAFWRPSTGEWYVVRSEDDTFFAFPFGVATDIPVPGDYDGDGKADAAIFRPSENIWYLLRSTAGFQAVAFGATGDRPLPNSYVR